MTPPPHPSTATPNDAPVFVDPSGRRLRRVRWLTWCVFGAVAAYLVLVLSPFFGGPSIGSAFLPAPQQQDGPHAAPSLPTKPSEPAPGSALTAQSSAATQQNEPLSNRASTAPTATPATGTPSPTMTTSAGTTAPAPTSSTAPTTAPSASATDPGKSQSAPGQTRRPTRPPKP
jgi:hypothetical protein